MNICTSVEEQKRARYIRENVYLDIIIFSCISSTKACLRFLLNRFVREIKGFYQSSLGNGIDFKDIMSVSPNILAKNWNLKTLRHSFVDERTLIRMTLISFCHWKTLAPFWKTWKRIFNTNIELSQNRTKKQIIPFKTTVHWIFNDTWCYLVIGCFDWKIGLFQQTVVRGLMSP